MAKIRFHKIAAVVVLVATAAWVATGEFSSIGSAIPESGPESQAVPANEEAPLRTVAVVEPPRTEHARAIRISGLTEATRRATLASRAAGIIADLPVDEGSRVETGDRILLLDAEDKAAAVETAERLLEQREREFDAAERLARTGSAARLTVDNARSALAAARSQLEAATADLARNEVVAPFSGIIDRVVVERGSSITAGGEVATLLDLDPIIVRGEVSERDLGYLKVGDNADVRLVDGREVRGQLRYISRDASPQTRTFRVDVSIANPDLAVPAGMTAEITLRAAPVDSVMLPRSVVTLSSGGDLGVRVVGRDDLVAFVPIDIVDDSPRGFILGGVPADARVIVAGQEFVSEGDRVNAVEADRQTLERLAGDL